MKLLIGNKIDRLPTQRNVFRLTVESILGDGDDYVTNVAHFTADAGEQYTNIKHMIELLEEYISIDWNTRCDMTMKDWVTLYDDMFLTQPTTSMVSLIQELAANSSDYGATYNPLKWEVTFIGGDGEEYKVNVTLNDIPIIGEYK